MSNVSVYCEAYTCECNTGGGNCTLDHTTIDLNGECMGFKEKRKKKENAKKHQNK